MNYNSADADYTDIGGPMEEADDATPSAPPSSDPVDDDSDLVSIASDVADEAVDDSPDEQPRDEFGRYQARDESADNDDATDDDQDASAKASEEPDGQADDADEDSADATGDDQAGDAALPDHMAEWTDDQLAALDQLPEEYRTLIRQPDQFAASIYQETLEQVRPFMETMQPFADVLTNQEVSAPLMRRASELSLPPQQIVENILKADAFLAYSTDVQQRNQFAVDMLRGYGIEPLELMDIILGGDGGQTTIPGGNSEVETLRRELANERWQRTQLENQTNAVRQQAGQQRFGNEVATFASATGDDGQPLHPLMQSGAARAFMGQLIEQGRANSLEQAYQLAEAEFAPFTQQAARRISSSEAKANAERRARSVQKAKRAAPVRTATNGRGAAVEDKSLEDIVAESFSEMAS